MTEQEDEGTPEAGAPHTGATAETPGSFFVFSIIDYAERPCYAFSAAGVWVIALARKRWRGKSEHPSVARPMPVVVANSDGEQGCWIVR